MSYEGYEQFLCEDGHLYTLDAFWFWNESEDGTCPIPGCGKKPVWNNSVDQTNGCSAKEEPYTYGAIKPDHSNCICGMIVPSRLEVLEDVKTETCPTCKHVKVLAVERYKIPEGLGRRIEPEKGESS